MKRIIVSAMLVMFAVGAFAQETKYIDSHMHCAVLDDNMGLDKAIKWMDANNIERGVILELEGSEAHNEADRKKWRELFKKYEGRLSPFIRMDARDVTTKEATLEFLNQRKSDGVIGFGEYYIQDGERSFESPKVDIILEACADVGFPFLFHLQDAKDGFPSILENTLKKHPKCIFIAHANGWWCRMGTGDLDRLLQTYPNLYADVSAGSGERALVKDLEYTKKFIIRNADKLLFGTDAGPWSYDKTTPPPHFSILKDLDLPVDVQNKLYRENTIKLLGL